MEKKTYQIAFKAELTEDDVRAMKKCFYDAMLEAMEISPVWDLKLEPVEDPDSEVPTQEFAEYEPDLEDLLKLPMRHIEDIKKCFEACKSKQDVLRVLELAPNMFGEWTIEFDDEYDCFTIINTYFDDDEGELEEEYCYDYPDDWDYEIEDDRLEMPWDYCRD